MIEQQGSQNDPYGIRIVDGAGGNDEIVVLGGAGITTAGGLGRDYIQNTSLGGELWGDIANSIYDAATGGRYVLKTVTDADGKTRQEKDYIADDASNADNFAWAPGTTIFDPQNHDVLTFFGIPLVGGNDSGGLYLSFQPTGLFGGTAGGFAGLAQLAIKPEDTLYFDAFLPFINYKFEKQADGSYDLLVGNVLGVFTNFLTAEDKHLSKKLQDAYGVQRVKQGKFATSYFAPGQFAESSLNLVFKKSNGLSALAEIVAAVVPTAIGIAASQILNLYATLDLLYTTVAAYQRRAKGLGWATGADPLVLDLSGTGLITTNLGDSNVHFDLNNNFFAERTAWLAGNAGFLALDKNGNGRIDDATELFGTFTGSGFDDLAAYDDNHDRVITAADAAFAKLRVWVDSNGDAITDAGELKSLDALNIASISLNKTDLNGTTAQGTELRAASTYTLKDGTRRAIYEAIFPTDQTSTVYRGETGAPSWSAGTSIDAKGFGQLTNLAIAAANDLELGELLQSRARQLTWPELQTACLAGYAS